MMSDSHKYRHMRIYTYACTHPHTQVHTYTHAHTPTHASIHARTQNISIIIHHVVIDTDINLKSLA